MGVGSQMTIAPITSTYPACLGVLCQQHNDCARYHAVETLGSANAIGNCLDGREWPLFVQVEKEDV